jgi:uncharacterized membrane protein YfcA
MDFMGYFLLIIMGITLGLIGAGGSILTIPILVYSFDYNMLKATTYSLAIVGSTALIGSFIYRKNINLKRAVLFLIPSVIGMFISRHFILTALPKVIYGYELNKILMLLLICFMSIASFFMIKQNNQIVEVNYSDNKFTGIFLALNLGIIMGIIGAGGGFLIIPTLVLLMGFTIIEAIPTSLFIITINSLVGFFADKYQFSFDDWYQLSKFLICAYLGMLVGIFFARFIKAGNLKKYFGYFIILVAFSMFFREFIQNPKLNKIYSFMLTHTAYLHK